MDTVSLIDKKIEEIYQRLKNESKIVANPYDYHWTIHTETCTHVSLDGLWLEFGVYRGRSICNFARLTNSTIYGFDSFEGLPEKWNNENPLGVFSLAGVIPSGAIAGSNDDNPGMYSTETNRITQPWPKNVKLVKGWFEDSLPVFIRDYTKPDDKVAFLHVDSDIYSSCNTVLTLLEERIVPGTVILFDEICNYPEFREHEIKAFAEFLLRTGYDYKPLVHQDLDYGQGSFIILEKK